MCPKTASTLGLCAVVMLLAVSGCAAPDAEPVARLEIDEPTLELPFPEWRSLHLTWTPEKEVPRSGPLLVFLHLLNEDGELVRTFDHPLDGEWVPNQPLSYEVRIFQSALGPPLEPGDYTLTAGLYTADGERFPLTVGDNEVSSPRRREYRLATVSVPEVSPDAPGFAFANNWGALETGEDAQILGRRWLEDDGVIRVLNLEVPGSVWMRLRIPAEDGDGSGRTRSGRKLALRDSGQAPTLEVASSCSGAVRILEVPGTHEEVLPVFPQAESPECTLRLSANYRLVDATTLREDVAALEIIAWTPAEL
ncbi:MAG: hypothetical protein SX243_22890 [Acidobacteriota bacterium]|nr:hypothetical protein [Acidobacteriota bacterium]